MEHWSEPEPGSKRNREPPNRSPNRNRQRRMKIKSYLRRLFFFAALKDQGVVFGLMRCHVLQRRICLGRLARIGAKDMQRSAIATL